MQSRTSALGQEIGYPIGREPGWRLDPYRVGSWWAMDRVEGLQVRKVSRGPQVVPLPGEVVAERYRYGRTSDARFLSFSMAKSVTALLVGIALDKGVMASLDDIAEKYARSLAGSPYGGTTLRQLLRMSSGLIFTERYDGSDDVARMSRAAESGKPALLEVLRSVIDRHSAPGQKFVYASAETEVLGRVLAEASGRTLAEITSEWLWQPLGAEQDAFWVLSDDGQERAWAYFNAALRDWARLGGMLASDGRANERQVISREYLLDATDPQRQPGAFRPGRARTALGVRLSVLAVPISRAHVRHAGRLRPGDPCPTVNGHRDGADRGR
jgi:CubicO group peptidase (beta-lactamase class C family)